MMLRLTLLSALFSFAPLSQACGAPSVSGTQPGEELRELEVQRLDGSRAPLGEIVPGLARGEVVVLAASEVGCPIGGKLAPRLARLAHEFADHGVRFVAFDASLQDTLDKIEHDS